MTLQLSHQRPTPDMGVKPLYIRPANVLPPFSLQAVALALHGPLSAPMPSVVLTEGVNRQHILQLQRHPFQHHRILRRPDCLHLPTPPHNLHGAEPVGVPAQLLQNIFPDSGPVKPQVPDIRIRRGVLTPAAAPGKCRIQDCRPAHY
ncbi:MAG: hypothetical protein E7E83_11025 [Enterobacter ludwigii]|nr:hypothetical protein [Enterobacter ludwigii]